jgi:hypothetical protein
MFKLRAPFTACVGAPPGSGKSTFVLKLLRHLKDVVEGHFEHIVWCFGEEGGVPSEIASDPKMRTFRGVPNEESGLLKPQSLLILDDLMAEASNQCIADLYTRGSRHRKISVILITQNIFNQSRFSRNISLSTRYFVLLKNVRDRAQFMYLARQIYPENPRSLCAALNDAWATPFSYLLIDLDPRTPESLRFRTNIFPTDPHTIVYATDGSVQKLKDTFNSHFSSQL